jgi:4-hydroxybenzoate polyprenyltransferase
MDQRLKSHPLVVDLDGTLVKTDLLIESLFSLIKKNPLYLILALFWLLKGKAFLKCQIAQRVTLDVSVLPYHQQFLEYLKDQHAHGRQLVLATGTDERIASSVAEHLRIFDRVLATNGMVNLTHQLKRRRLVMEYGEKGFDYAGNERRDLVVWSSARRSIIVNAPERVAHQVALVSEIEQIFSSQGGSLSSYLHTLRVSHWLKNLLIFIPLMLVHRYNELDLLGRVFLAFLSFGLSASCMYIINDMADLPADRRHPRKRMRPFAAGDLSLAGGLALALLLFILSIILACFLRLPFIAILLLYYLLNLGYSFTLKQFAVLDVIVLAVLYTLRILAGSAALSIWLSSWLVAFSMFIFFSLALVKRYAELVLMRKEHGRDVRVRGYLDIDKELLASMGAGSGYLAVLVLAIYIASGAVELLYKRHEVLWLLCPLLLYWISYIWLVAHRGEMEDDPVVFAVKNTVSQIVALLAILIVLLARYLSMYGASL